MPPLLVDMNLAEGFRSPLARSWKFHSEVTYCRRMTGNQKLLARPSASGGTLSRKRNAQRLGVLVLSWQFAMNIAEITARAGVSHAP